MNPPASFVLCLALVACGSEGGFRTDGGSRSDGGSGGDGAPGMDVTTSGDAGGADATGADAIPGQDVTPGADAVPGQDANPPADTGPRPDGAPPSFTENIITEAIDHGQNLEAVDIDGNGSQDIAVALSLTDTVHLYLNDGAGNFTPKALAPANTIVAMDVAVADLDGDGDRDVAAVGLFDRNVGFQSAGEVTWFRNPGSVTGNWTRETITGLSFWAPFGIEAGDLTGDGRADLVVARIELQDQGGNGQGNGVSWFRNTGGAFQASPAIDANLMKATAVRLHDVDGDGVLDAIAAGQNSNAVAWYENQRSSGATVDNPGFTRHEIGAPAAPHGIALGNMDGDGALEVAVAATGASAILYYDPPQDPTQTWTEHTVTPAFGWGDSARLAIADFDGDGLGDVVATNSEAAIIQVYLNRNGSFEELVVAQGHNGVTYVATGDFDGDSRADFVTSTYNFDTNNEIDRLSFWRNTP